MSDEQITVQEIIEIHADIIRDFGGASGIRDSATLDYIIYQVNRTRNILRKSAIILYGISHSGSLIKMSNNYSKLA